MNPAAERLIWGVNGLMVVFFSLGDHFLTIFLGISTGAFIWLSPNEQRDWSIGASVLALVASVFSPAPIPIFLVVMSLGGWVALYMEKYNLPATRWNVIRGISLYAVLGLGYALYKGFDVANAIATDPQMGQGAIYLNAIIGIALYAVPLGFLVMISQSIWAHPPTPGGNPASLIGTIRARGKD